MIIQKCIALGARGYTSLECRSGRGQGHHGTFQDLFSGAATRVRIEFLVEPDVGERIVEILSSERYDQYALLICMENVQVAGRECC